MTDLSSASIDAAIARKNIGKRSPDNAKISKAYADAQGEMVEPIMNGVGYHKNRYATMADIRKVTRPIAAKHGLSLCFSVDAAENYVATLRHSSGEWFSVSYPLRFTTDERKMTAAHMTQQSTLTYAERRCLLMIWGVSGEEEEGEGLPPKEENKKEDTGNGAIVTPIDESF
tara:strand:- start:172 stop:687 length:516 start_codon:yes stop_codon:yes gene_type:complete